MAAPTSMRSVRTNPGHTETTDDARRVARRELVRGVGGDAVERALPHAVRDLPRVLLGARRAHVHDEPCVRGHHRACGEHAGDVGGARPHVDHVVPVGEVGLPERQPRRQLVGHDERVVHEHVEPSVLGEHPVEQRLDRGVVAVVERDRDADCRRLPGRWRRSPERWPRWCPAAGGRPHWWSGPSRRPSRRRRRARARCPCRSPGSRR